MLARPSAQLPRSLRACVFLASALLATMPPAAPASYAYVVNDGAAPSGFAPVWPTRGLITTRFGDLSGYSPRGHSGIDVAGPVGTPVVAADAGEVVKADWDIYGYGRLVVIAHAGGFETWYGHLSAYQVEAGQQVKRGELIGQMGSSGMSTGSHLHFEVRENGALRNPMLFLDDSPTS